MRKRNSTFGLQLLHNKSDKKAKEKSKQRKYMAMKWFLRLLH